MASRNTIKGLTVEIGGDTTKLGKALESVNKKSDSLSAELKEINGLLKFNPDSAELLAQKQKVLAESIETTSEKLKALKEAEKQVQKQFERGEVSEEQVRALQREIVETEGKLNAFKKQADGAADKTEELGDSAEETGIAFEGMGGKLASAAKIGIGAVVAGATAAVGALVASAEATREYRTEMGKLDTAFTTAGHSSEAATETYKALQGILGETEQAVEAANHLAQLAENEEDLAKWTEIATGVYATFGASLPIENLTEAANETAKTGALTGGLADALNWAGVNEEQFQAQLDECTTEQERQALITATLNGLYSEAADKYRETNAEIIRANEATEAWTATLAEAGAAVEPLLTDVKLLGASLLTELMPGVTQLTTAFRGLVNGEEGSAQAVGEALSGLLSQILNRIVELLPQVVEIATSLITTLATTIISMIPQLVETLIQVVTTILQGLTQAIPLIVQAIVDMVPVLVQALVDCIPMLIDGAVQFLLAILDAIPLVIPPLVEAIPAIVLAVIDALLSAIPQLIEGALQFLMAIVRAVPLLIDALLPQIPTIVDTVINGLLDNIPLLIDAAIQLFFAILEAIPEICAALIQNAPKIIASIVKGLMNGVGSIFKAGYDLIAGLIDGMFSFDIFGALADLGNSIVEGFKSIFDIHSPSRVMAGLGELLDEGLAVGIKDNANAPVNALDKLSQDMLGEADSLSGLSIERRMSHTVNQGSTTTTMDGIASQLDQIYKAIREGRIMMLDGKTFIGATADRYDNELGQRRVLAERGAL